MKIALLGEGAVGKTSLRRKYLGDSFSSEYMMTIGADFALKNTKINDDYTLKMQIWDLAGQPRFSSVRKAYYLGCLGGLLVFDRTRPESLELTYHWLNELWSSSGRGPVPFIILGNKSDLLTESVKNIILNQKVNRIISAFNEETFPRKGFNTHYITTSAKTGLNVDLAFHTLATEILNYISLTKKKTST